MEDLTDDTFFTLATFLAPRDLVSLASSCKRFGVGGQTRRRAKRTKKRRKAANGGAELSLVEEAARRIMGLAESERERIEYKSMLQRRGGLSWLRLYDRLHLLRTSLVFTHFNEFFRYRNGDATHIRPKLSRVRSMHWRTRETYGSPFALCQGFIMKEGKHYAEFTVTEGRRAFPGIVRPAKQWFDSNPSYVNFGGNYNVFCQRQSESGVQGYSGDANSHCHFHYSQYTQCWPLSGEDGDDIKLGLLLDLDEGTLTFYCNGSSKGVVKRGLAGHYCWAMAAIVDSVPSVRIRKAPLPPSVPG